MSWAMDALEARARRQLDSLHTLNESLQGIRESETSPDGEVTAVVDGVGALVDLHLSERISRLSGTDLASLVVATSHVACQRAFARRAAILHEFNDEFSTLVSPDQDASPS